MIRCPSCQHPTSTVIDSRSHAATIRRRRECRRCHHRFNTQERVTANLPTTLFPLDQKVLDDIARHKKHGRTIKELQRHHSLSAAQLGGIVNRLRQAVHPYGYTITRPPYRLKVLGD